MKNNKGCEYMQPIKYVDWKRVVDTKFSTDASSTVTAVGTGILDPIKGSITNTELNLKSICPYHNGTFAIGDWKIFVEQFDVDQIAEVAMSQDVNDCVFAVDSKKNPHFYMTTSDGYVYYGQEMGTFTKLGQINDTLNGVRYIDSKRAQKFVFFGKDMLSIIDIDVCRINPSKFAYYRDKVGNIISAGMYTADDDDYTNYIIALNDDNTLICVNIVTGKFYGLKISLADIVRNVISKSKSVNPTDKSIDFPEFVKINNICIKDNDLYLLCEGGYIGLLDLSEIIANGINSECDNVYLTKITNTDWKDMIFYNNFFIGVGAGKPEDSFFKLSNLKSLIYEFDFLHNMKCSKEYKDLCNMLNTKKNSAVFRRTIEFEITNEGTPYCNLDNIIDFSNKINAVKLKSFIEKYSQITILPLNDHITSTYDSTIQIKEYGDGYNTKLRITLPNINATYFKAIVSIILPSSIGEI